MESPSTSEAIKALDRLERALDTANDRHRQLRRERKQLWDRVEEMRRDKEKSEALAASTVAASENDKKQLAELQEQMQQAKQTHAEYEVKKQALESEVALREATIKDRENTIEQLRKSKADAQTSRTRVEQLEGELAELQEQLKNASEQTTTQQSELEAKYVSVIAERDQAVESMTAATVLSAALRARIEQLESTVAENAGQPNAASEIDELKQKLTQAREEIENAERELIIAKSETERILERQRKRAQKEDDGTLRITDEEREQWIEQITSAIAVIDDQLQRA